MSKNPASTHFTLVTPASTHVSNVQVSSFCLLRRDFRQGSITQWQSTTSQGLGFELELEGVTAQFSACCRFQTPLFQGCTADWSQKAELKFLQQHDQSRKVADGLKLIMPFITSSKRRPSPRSIDLLFQCSHLNLSPSWSMTGFIRDSRPSHFQFLPTPRLQSHYQPIARS